VDLRGKTFLVWRRRSAHPVACGRLNGSPSGGSHTRVVGDSPAGANRRRRVQQGSGDPPDVPPTGERGPNVDIVVRTLPGCEPGSRALRDTVPSMEGQRWRRSDSLRGDWDTCPFGCTPPRSQPFQSFSIFFRVQSCQALPSLASPRQFFLTVWAFPSESSQALVVRAGPGMGCVRVSRAALRACVRDWRRLAGGSPAGPVLWSRSGPDLTSRVRVGCRGWSSCSPGGRRLEPVRQLDVYSLGVKPGAGPGCGGPTRFGSMSLHPGSYECYWYTPERVV
jgi:hypothetical protein